LVLRVLALLLVVPLLSGCPLTGAREEAADDYVRSLASLLDTPVRLSPIPTVTAMPRMRERRLELTDLEMGVVDFLSLYGCELQVVVGERTSVLGRVAHPGTRMAYHVRFIEAARDCLPRIDSEGRAERVREAMEAKRESLPRALWNGIWATEEIQSFFTRTSGTLPPAPETADFRNAEAHAERILGIILALRRGHLGQDLSAVTNVYEHWQSRPLMGQLLRSAVALTARLQDATALIESRLRAEAVCSTGNNGYERFFRLHYLDGLAKRLRFVRNQQARLVPLFRQLVDAPGVRVPDAMTSFVRHNLESGAGNSVWSQLDEAVRDHVGAWNRLLIECGA